MPTLIIDSSNYPYYDNYSKRGYKCLSNCVPPGHITFNPISKNSKIDKYNSICPIRPTGVGGIYKEFDSCNLKQTYYDKWVNYNIKKSHLDTREAFLQLNYGINSYNQAVIYIKKYKPVPKIRRNILVMAEKVYGNGFKKEKKKGDRPSKEKAMKFFMDKIKGNWDKKLAKKLRVSVGKVKKHLTKYFVYRALKDVIEIDNLYWDQLSFYKKKVLSRLYTLLNEVV